jgi:hypothetical protein
MMTDTNKLALEASQVSSQLLTNQLAVLHPKPLTNYMEQSPS